MNNPDWNPTVPLAISLEGGHMEFLVGDDLVFWLIAQRSRHRQETSSIAIAVTKRESGGWNQMVGIKRDKASTSLPFQRQPDRFFVHN